ncbi:MAG TPA: response regulator [Gemmatimonadales bacterium]|jgi:PAS domain S-box-containing protein
MRSATDSVPRPPRTSLFTVRPETEIGAVQPGVTEDVGRELVRRLLAEGPRAEVAHLVILAIVVAVLWGLVDPAVLGVWAAVIVGLTVIRGALRRWLLRNNPPVQTSLRRIRPMLAVTGMAWGIGVAAFMPDIPVQKTGLLLVVLAGLTAGGIASLAADLWCFRYYLAGLLAPVPIGLLGSSMQTDAVLTIILILLFGAAMTIFHRRSYLLLQGYLLHAGESERNERKAVRDRAYLDGLLASAPVAIAVLDGESRVRGTNPQFERLFGYTAEHAIGRDINELIVPKSEMAKAGVLNQRARRGETVVVEVERRRKDGHLVPVRASATRVESIAESDLFVMYEDITDRRKAQDAVTRLANIVETSEDAIIGQTLDGKIVSWNAAAQRMFGYTLGEVQGQSISLLAPPDRAEEVARNLDRIRRGEHIEHFETVRLRKDGTRIPVSMSISLTRDTAGQISGFSAIARDVSEQVATRDALRVARDAAERMAQTRSAFLANMSHEIRTPMNAILGLTELTLDTELAPEQRHSLSLVQSSAETLLTLINDILDFSKIEAEHLQLESIPFDLPRLVESTMGLLAVRARERRLELLTDVQPNVPPMVRGDPTRLRQVLTNLIGNAIKFTPQGEVVVGVASVLGPDGRALVRFAVRDSGIGIPTEKLSAIFEEFSQADVSTTRQYGGTGLGLAIAQRLVRLMGGELAVTSEVGRGTEFYFAIPLEAEIAPLSPEAPAHGAVHLAGLRALVVDDNATNRRIVQDMLGAAGIRVHEAEDGDAGLAAISAAHHDQAPYDLVVLDAQMPRLDGFELAAAVRRDPKIATTRLLMLTSAGQRGDGQRCRELGIHGYLPKPASRSDLIEAVRAVLGSPAIDDFVTRHSIAESRKHLRILLAEDNPVNQEVAASMLRKRGHTVDVVGNGRAAVDAVSAEPYDLVLMDIQMPEMDGFEATQVIRARPDGGALPIIALTAHALSGERERCLSMGMSGYLSKPYKAHELFAAVEGWGQEISAGASPTAPAAPATAPPVDLDNFRQDMRAAGAEAAVDSILDTFLQTAPDRITAVTGALTAGSAPEIERAAHAFKSAAGAIGAKSLATLLLQLEEAGKAGEVAQARGLEDRFRNETDAVLVYLRAALATAPPRN